MVSYRNQIIEVKIESLLSVFDHFFFFSTRVECLGSRLFGISVQGEYKWCKSQCLMTENLRKRQYFSNPPPLDVIFGSHHHYLVTRVTAFSAACYSGSRRERQHTRDKFNVGIPFGSLRTGCDLVSFLMGMVFLASLFFSDHI